MNFNDFSSPAKIFSFATIKQLLIFVICAYGGFCLWFYLNQTKLIFAPVSEVESTPTDIDLPYQNINISVNNDHIHSWWIEGDNINTTKSLVVLFLHGNGSNISNYIYRLPLFHQLGLSTLTIDYRGYGLSSPIKLSEQTVYEDAQASLDYLLSERKIAPEQIILYGHSLGGAIVIDLAIKYPQLKAIIVEGTFTSMKDMINYVAPINFLPLNLILKQKFNSIEKIDQISSPLLILHGTKDTVVPWQMSEQLYDKNKSNQQLAIIDNADHTNIPSEFQEEYQLLMQEFINQIMTQ